MQALTRVLTNLGHGYGLDPNLIRPHDRLQPFYDLDSWSLGLGADRITKWLTEEGVTGIDTQPSTVLELIHLIEDRQKKT